MSFSEKKVPLRNVIGKSTKALNVLSPWWDFDKKAARTPNKENTKQDSTIKAMIVGLIISIGEITIARHNKAAQFIMPRTTPAKALPTIIENKLTGAIKSSSKLLWKIRSTFSFEAAPLKLLVRLVKAIIPGITKAR